MKPLVSVIIPTFNRAHLIGETLDSVLAQTYPNWECIIVDDGSSDEIELSIKQYLDGNQKIKFLNKPFDKLKGPSSSRNYGAQNAKGDFLLFLDSDDCLEVFCLEQRINAFKANELADFLVFPMKLNYNNSCDELKIPSEEDYLSIFLSNKFLWGVMCTLWKKEFFFRIGGFNEKMMRLEDPEIHIRAMVISTDFFVDSKAIADSIYNCTPINYKLAVDNHYNSLIIFFEQVYILLSKNDKKKYLIFLKSLLKEFIIFYFNYSSFSKIKYLIKICYKYKIINISLYCKITIFVYLKRIILVLSSKLDGIIIKSFISK